jgi:hypothetical protein
MASFWDFIPAIIMAGATIYGAEQKSSADSTAAAEETAAQTAATAAQVQGINNAAAVTATNQAAASPGLMADQAIIARGTALTPAQQQAVNDANVQSISALNGTGLRGSAQATAATVANTTARNTATFEQQNQNNANAAAGQLTGQYFQAGNNLAQDASNVGTVTSQGLVSTGNIEGSNTVGQGNLIGNAIGAVGATVANIGKSNIVNSNLNSTPTATTTATAPGQQTSLNYNALGQPVAAPSQYTNPNQNGGGA